MKSFALEFFRVTAWPKVAGAGQATSPVREQRQPAFPLSEPKEPKTAAPEQVQRFQASGALEEMESPVLERAQESLRELERLAPAEVSLRVPQVYRRLAEPWVEA